MSQLWCNTVSSHAYPTFLAKIDRCACGDRDDTPIENLLRGLSKAGARIGRRPEERGKDVPTVKKLSQIPFVKKWPSMSAVGVCREKAALSSECEPTGDGWYASAIASASAFLVVSYVFADLEPK